MGINYLKILKNIRELLQTLLTIRNERVRNDKFHLKLAGDWLIGAQSVNNDGGYAHSYSLYEGWGKSYPETTGYIIPTMLNLGEYLKAETYILSSFKAGEWLLEIQQLDGSFLDLSGKKQIFDTGQAIEGLVYIYKKTNDEKFLTSSIKAGDFIVNNQDGDGKWSKFAYNNLPHTYYSKVAGNLLKLYKISGENKYKVSAQKNLEWIIGQQKNNGYFDLCSFKQNELPYLHNIIYVLEGLLASYNILKEDFIWQSLMKTVEKLLKINEQRDFILYSQYDQNWNCFNRDKCLTGLAQWSILLLELYKMTKEERYFCQAVKTIHYLNSKQIARGSKNILGALPDTIPIWGNYRPFSFSNWTVKFYIDALLFLSMINYNRKGFENENTACFTTYT